MEENIEEKLKSNELPEEKEPTIEEVEAEILFIKQTIHQEGSFDSEDGMLNGIIEDMKTHKITPKKARELANNLENNRESYH
jgi:hypothetical protein